MPRFNIYIRTEDEALWETIEDRPQWLHDNLVRMEPGFRNVKLPQFDKPIKVKKSAVFCKKGHIADEYGKCLNKECQYGR